jgi:hypothetical protein
MQSLLCYGMSHMMLFSLADKQKFLVPVCLCVVLTACGAAPSRKSDVLDIYELPRAGQGTTIYTAPVDNDSYYVQPQGYKGCAQIGDAPSCGGG